MNIDRVRPVPLRAAGSRFGAHTTLSFAPAHLPIGARAYAPSAQLRNAYPVDPPIDCHLGMLATPTSRRKMPARPFHRTGILARQTGVSLALNDTEPRAFALARLARFAAG